MLPLKQKCALIIGINYAGRPPIPTLPGCISDGSKMDDMLRTHMGYTEVTFLRDDINIAENLPTKSNIMTHLYRLSTLSESLDEICIYYGGHGGLIPDFNGDERFNADSIIYPCDTFDVIPPPPDSAPLPPGLHYIVGPIVDDELQTVIRRFRCPTLIFMDCCNNGTGMDLEWSFNEILSPYNWSPRIQNNNKNIDYPNIFMISGSRDEQLSIEFPFYNNYTQYGGFLTFVLLNCLRDAQYSIDIAKLYSQMYFAIKQFSATLASLTNPPPGGFQNPVLSSSSPSPAYTWTNDSSKVELVRSPSQVIKSSMAYVKWSSANQRFHPKLL
jgi:hypothetical protein